MNARVIVAQNEPSFNRGLDGHSPHLIRLNKPQGDQALTIHLDGRVQLDFSGIAGENITLVHAGDRLVILFDNRAAVTLDPFYGPDGQPLAAISIHLGPDRDVSGTDFAALFPVTTDQSVLPATGNGSPAVGGGFAPSPPQVDALATGQALPLLEADRLAARGSTDLGESRSVNHVPTAVADHGAVIEAGVHPGNTAFAGVSVAHGNVLANDVDLDADDIKLVVGVAVGAAAAVTGQVGTMLTGIYGSLVLQADGSWTYTLDNANAATQALAQGVHGSDVFTYTMRDAQGETSTTTLTLDVLGSNDAPVMPAGAALALHEDSGQTQSSAVHMAAGTLGFSDVDLSDSHTVGVALAAAQWSGGKTIPAATLSDAATALTAAITADNPGAAGSIGWSFGLGDADVDFLGAGETLVLTYQVTVTDNQSASAAQTVTVTITGSNDAPLITAAATAEITEQPATTGSSAPDHVTGTLNFTDVDRNDTGHIATVMGVASSGTLAGLSATAADLQSFLHIDGVTKAAGSESGSVGWTFSAPDNTFDYLAAGETLTLTYKVALDDHHGGTAGSTISITVTGSNDAPVLTPSAPALPGITEDQTSPAGTTVASLLGNHVTDADSGAAQGIAVTGAIASHWHWQFSIDGGGTWIDFGTYSAGSALLLAPTDLVRMAPDGNDGGGDSFSFVAWDQSSGQHGLTIDASTRGGSSAFSAQSDTAAITVEAINDAPVIHAPNTITVAGGTSLTLANSFAITVTDVDAGGQTIDETVSVTHGSLYVPQTNSTIPAGGVLHVSGSLSVMTELLKDAVFTPDAGFSGQAQITISVSDNGHSGAGGSLSDSRTVIINVENNPVITSGRQTADITEDFTGTVPLTERVTNGGFEATATFSGWTNTGFVALGEPHTGSTSVGAYLATYSLSQTLATVAGITYHVSFWASNPFDNGAESEGMTVSWGGATVFALGNIPPSGGYRNFTHYDFDVVATGASSALGLTMWDTQGWWVLDDVSVTAKVTPGIETARGTITFTDADRGDTHAVAYTTPAGSHYYGTFAPTLTHDTTGTGTGGVVDWSFSVDDSTIHFLAANQTLIQTYTVSIDDGHGGHATRDVTVTLHGTNDAPVGVSDIIIIDGYSGTAPGTAAATPVFTETENNGTIATANAIDRTALMIAPNSNLTDTTDPSITIHGALGSNGDKDYYKIDLKAGETVTLDIDNSTGGLDSYLRFYNSGGTQIAVNDDSSSTSIGGGGSSTTHDSYLSYSVTQDGTYYIQVGSFNSGSKGAYDLQLSIDNYEGLSGAPVSIATATLLANDTDADDGHVLSITGVTGAGVSLNGDHILVQPNVTSFSYTVSDGIAQSTATVSVIQKSGQSSTGTGGDDILFGTGIADRLDGAGGNDVLIGGLGNDTLTGGSGHDRFVFAESGAANLDRILDFSSDDALDLSGLLDAAIGNGSNVADVVRVVRGAPGSSDVTVQVDTDGTAAGATWTDVAVLSNYNTSGNVIQAIFEHAQHQLTVT